MIVGVDISTHRIDLAWLENDKPQRWHQELGKGATIDRIRRIHVQWPAVVHPFGVAIAPGASMTDVCIEEPWGRGKALAPLHQVLGIVTRQAPSWARVAHVSSGDLRKAIGAKNTKVDAHTKLQYHLSGGIVGVNPIGDWDEHELDSLVACIAWTRILGQQGAA